MSELTSLDPSASSVLTPHGAPRPRRSGVPQVTRLDTLEAQAIQWLWPGWLPRGALAVLDGDPGLGKSTLTLDIAARVTRGRPMPLAPEGGPDGAGEPGDVLLMSAEDDPTRTILPRLRVAGADLARVHLLRTVSGPDGDRLPVLPYDLEAALKRLPPVRMAVIDPFLAYLGSAFDACNEQEIRQCLHALGGLAEQYQTTPLLLRHLNKSNGRHALYRGSGAIGILGVARACLLVGRDPEEPKQVILAMNKCNLAEPPASLSYRLEVADGVTRIAWLGRACYQAGDLVGQATARPVDACALFLKELLDEGPRLAAEVEQLCADHGWTRSVYHRARQQAKVESHRITYGGPWMCHLQGRPVDPIMDKLHRMCDPKRLGV